MARQQTLEDLLEADRQARSVAEVVSGAHARMSVLHTVLWFLVAIGVLVVVHEFGHYLAARWAGVKVLRFSVGFGKPLLSRRFGQDQTEWTLAALPFGGFVKMLDEREGEVPAAEAHRSFNRATVWRRIGIVAAGPAGQFPAGHRVLLGAVHAWTARAETDDRRTACRIGCGTGRSGGGR